MTLLEYFKTSVTIIKSHRIILWMTGALGVMNILILLLIDSKIAFSISIILFLLSAIAISIIFGMYYEIIVNKFSSVKEIFSKYSFGYIVLSLCMFGPVAVLTTILDLTIASENSIFFLQQSINIIATLVFLYVVPYYYISNKIVVSIVSGVKYLFKNIAYSTPIIFIVFLVEVLKIIAQMELSWIFETNRFVFLFIQCGTIIAIYLFEYCLFITLILILTKKEIFV